ncbi:MAG: hypothetical protein CMN55_16385 [Sneathiella sp.]|jgi:hypothetical protein|uniref:hypothetical protein n=1 Tax=Sneathiella sp. TaxID=1964365 RepID=UPI000C5F03B7|nr:hypothetical protein [Sneathiella sp.]MAL80656.1 hypothetical protein [Sneathiella sp.]|tara:strand:+ start:4022 stop:4390 length:369 start_codon:yes stop_codon:yes gene_type:complete
MTSENMREVEFILREAKYTATFLSSFAFGFSCLNNDYDLSADDWQGLYELLKNHSKNLKKAEEMCEAYNATLFRKQAIEEYAEARKQRIEESVKEALLSAEKAIQADPISRKSDMGETPYGS